jgi:putative sterol carrier protein
MNMATFPTDDWVKVVMDKLNADPKYAQVARNWEGDMVFVVEPGGVLTDTVTFYLDLWHGKCRDAYPVKTGNEVKAVFTLNAPYDNYVRLLKGDLDPIQALLTRKIAVHGNMAVLMRNVPTVIDFVRCCREITDGFI